MSVVVLQLAHQLVDFRRSLRAEPEQFVQLVQVDFVPIFFILNGHHVSLTVVLMLELTGEQLLATRARQPVLVAAALGAELPTCHGARVAFCKPNLRLSSARSEAVFVDAFDLKTHECG